MENIAVKTHWDIQCHAPDGTLLWEESVDNLVTDAGYRDILSQYFKGAGYTAQWYIGLINSPLALSAADTMASHGGWTENVNYDVGARPTLILGEVQTRSVNNDAARAKFLMTGVGGNIAGTFLASNNLKSGVVGTLFSEAAFGDGPKQVNAGSTLTVLVTITGGL